MADTLTLDRVRELDADDPLKSLRAAFVLPEGLIYLDGNSLGPASETALAGLDRAAVQEWGQDLIRSWNSAGWFQLPLDLGDRVGRLIGAAPGQVAVTDSTSVNIFKALSAAAGLRPGRNVILAEGSSFPTDLYIAEGFVASQPGLTLRLQGEGERIEDMLGPDVAVVLLNHVNYRSGRLLDMAALTRKIHQAGALTVWDLCHSAGALDVDLDGAGADFAVGCTYKYLNGGPGAPAFVYVAERHQAEARQPLSGWWGHARPFDFATRYEGAPQIARFLCGTQPILSLRALKGALEVWEGVDMAVLRRKSLALTDLFIALVENRCGDHGLDLQTPRDHRARGSQVSFSHPAAWPLVQALIERGVIGDFRAPDVLRFGLTPLYLRFEDVWNAVEMLRDVLDSGVWQEARFTARHAVT
ncbi:Kynureninase [Paracoccus alcaliphilus]|uniref:Kynureninase n=1 Tax=Paracoccus alcaliphilus TaxID=34002 RepID=A0A1H8J4D9_9RHOB|nr:kynureninase [Paracoccus alcaliphilus]WCR16692.1 kynureninase [Paracoccus alcaliphilus]SEN75612.1 Kynureninase [Paracoccus alcaliphilus]